MSYRHAKVIALASWESGGAVRSPGQSLRGGLGVGAHRSSENPGFLAVKWAIMGIAHNNVGKLDVLLQY